MLEKADFLEAETFLYKYAEVEAIDLLLPDTNGILRGKRVRHDALSNVYQEGINLPGSVFATMITGDTVEASGLGFDQGDADRLCWPMAGTLKPAPWQDRPMAQVLLSMFELDDQPFFADPRQVLSRVVDTFFAELKLMPVVALELEFYLLDRERNSDGRPQAPCSPVTGVRDQQTQIYGINELDGHNALLDEIIRTADRQGIPASSIIAEYAPGQYEVNLQHQTDPFAACDHAVMLKRVIKAIAQKHGMDASFMAKPYADYSGSGLHVHLSLQDEQGQNVFQDSDPLGNGMLRHAIAGLAITMAESMALFAPNANAFRRFQVDSYVPLSPVWGSNNRTLALRIPAGPEAARRIEHRVAGADANPYLVLASILAGVHHGISQRLQPEPPTSGNAHAQHQPSLPITWQDALHAFKQAHVMQDYLGADFCRVYAATKAEERNTFNRYVSTLEHAWYLQL